MADKKDYLYVVLATNLLSAAKYPCNRSLAIVVIG